MNDLMVNPASLPPILSLSIRAHTTHFAHTTFVCFMCMFACVYLVGAGIFMFTFILLDT